MSIILNGTTGITTPDVIADSGESLTSRVAKSGDTMTGTLNLSTGSNVIATLSGNQGGVYPADSFGGAVTFNHSAGGGELGFWNTWTGNNSRAFQFYQRTGSSSKTELMTIDTAGRVTMPYQPCFSAVANGGTNLGSNQTLPFPVVDVNTGGYYNTSTSTFTAPINGTYFFYFQALGDANTNDRVMAYIQKNGSNVVEASATTKDYNSIQAQVIVSLSAGDNIRIQTDGGPAGARFYAASNNQNWFMGYLLG